MEERDIVGRMMFTDYPFKELGDTPGEYGPVREVRVAAYDGDKYATVEFGGHTLGVKAGYLWPSAYITEWGVDRVDPDGMAGVISIYRRGDSGTKRGVVRTDYESAEWVGWGPSGPSGMSLLGTHGGYRRSFILPMDEWRAYATEKAALLIKALEEFDRGGYDPANGFAIEGLTGMTVEAGMAPVTAKPGKLRVKWSAEAAADLAEIPTSLCCGVDMLGGGPDWVCPKCGMTWKLLDDVSLPDAYRHMPGRGPVKPKVRTLERAGPAWFNSKVAQRQTEMLGELRRSESPASMPDVSLDATRQVALDALEARDDIIDALLDERETLTTCQHCGRMTRISVRR